MYLEHPQRENLLIGNGGICDFTAADRVFDLSVQLHAGKRRILRFRLVIACDKRLVGTEDNEISGSACCNRAIWETVC